MKEVVENIVTENLDKSIYDIFKEKIYKISPALMIAFIPIYLTWFGALQKYSREAHIVTIPIDRQIPFLEVFVIPYYMWFGYVAITMGYFMILSRRDFIRTGFFLVSGMVICLIIYTVWPNGVDIRPEYIGRDNIFVRMVQFVYSVDVPRNVFPSIHCFNSIAINAGFMKCERLKKRKKMRIFSNVLAVSICLSTVFIKQHSVLDFVGAVALSIPLYYLSYVMDWRKVFDKVFQKKVSNYE